MSGILLIGKANLERRDIELQLISSKNWKVELADSLEMAQTKIAQNKIDLVLWNIASQDAKQIMNVLDFRNEKGHLPILLVTDEQYKQELLKYEKAEALVILDKPYEKKDLIGICEKLIKNGSTQQRIHRRFYTKQNAKIEVFPSGESIPSNILNMSKGGCYIEASHNSKLKEGDLVKLDVSLPIIQKKYDMHAKVVWTKSAKDSNAIGVEFITKDDFYNQLFSKI